MTHVPHAPEPLPRIHTPCPKRWDELIGDDRKRFCEACSLHVHNGAALTRDEATAIVRTATERVCMRLEYDPAGEPVFRAPAPRRRTFAARAAAWMLSAADGVLAACARTTPPEPAQAPCPTPGTTNSTNKMGKVALPEKLGDVAAPLARLGEVDIETSAPAPTPPPDDKSPR
jgi:hypothetical protein